MNIGTKGSERPERSIQTFLPKRSASHSKMKR